MPLAAARAARAPRRSPHGPRRWRVAPAAVRPARRPAPGRALASRANSRARAALFVHGTSKLRHFTFLLLLLETPARTHVGTVCTTQRGHRSPAPITHTVRTIIVSVIEYVALRGRATKCAKFPIGDPDRRRATARERCVTKVESKDSKRTALKTLNRTKIAISRGSSPTPDPRNDATMLRRLHP